MDRPRANPLQNFEESKSDILKKRLLKAVATSGAPSMSQASQNNVLLNAVRTPSSSSMIMSSVQAPQPITHNLVTSLAPVKIHPNNAPYPLQLSTVHVPVQIPGSNSNISVPIHMSGGASNMTLQNIQIAPTSMPLQMSGTTSVPVQLPAGDTISVPLQFPANQNIIAQTLPSMPLLQNTNQIIHVQMGSNLHQPTNTNDVNTPKTLDSQVKINNPALKQSAAVVQIPNSSNNSIQLTLPSSGNSGPVQLRGTARTMPHVVYIQTPSGLKPVTSSDVISQASSSGNPPQIIVRRPVTTNSNILIPNVSSKPNIAPKSAGQRNAILAPASAQPIVIQKPKSTDKLIGPVSITQGPAKQAIYLSSVKKKPENQSILISNNQTASSGSQKLFLTPMKLPKIPNTKFMLPVSLPTTMATKGPIINLQIANGQIQNDPQGNSITVMRDQVISEASDMPPLQPLVKAGNKEGNSVPQSPKSEKSFTLSITGSRAEPTGEQGEYTLSIPETNASMNDDIYTVSIADEDGRQREKSFTLAIPEKSKSLLNRNVIDKSEISAGLPAPAILRRSNSDTCDKNINTANAKRRVSLCADMDMAKSFSKHNLPKVIDKPEEPEAESNDDHRVPSLFCHEKLDEVKNNLGDSDAEEFKDRQKITKTEKPDDNRNEAEKLNPDYYFQKMEKLLNKERIKPVNVSVDKTGENPLGLVWRNGIAHLKGSTLQFQTNEFGLIDVIDQGDPDEMLLPSVKYQTPIKQRIERGNPKKPSSPEDMYRCDGCGCHGMAAEFITPNFCSMQCQSDVFKDIQKKRERERLEFHKRKNKMKKLFLRKQLSESEIGNKDDKLSLRHYDSTPIETERKNEEFVENEKYPWMCGKNGFSWMRYLDFCKAKAAPVKLFKDPFPYTKNNFKVGMRMEAIDPAHPALFCVVSVAEVQGYRLRLHFDDYPEVYDYWVNADCIDLFPVGWCERNGRTLTPPPPYTPANFSWPLYLKKERAIAAPKHLFTHIGNQIIKPNGFRIGMKLEAEDRINDLVCVATIADMLDNRLRVNFDSWDDMYDMWVDPTSPYIHPVGWAEENGVPLTPPNFYKDSESFSWEKYLAETSASAAPARAFKTRAPQGFKPGMKLEVVDPRVPFLIRVASISSVSGHRVRVTCDGWGPLVAAWRDDDHPDLRPVGWCLKTQHPLEPPLTVEELNVIGACGVGGCRGLGSLRGGGHKQHSDAAHCPYRAKTVPLPDRLTPRPHDTARIPAKQLAKLHPTTPTADSPKDISKPLRGRPPKHKRVEQVARDDMSEDDSVASHGAGAGAGGKRWRASASPARTFSRTTDHRSTGHRSPPPAERAPAHQPPPPRVPADKYIAELGLPSSPLAWTERDVSLLVRRVGGTAAGEAALAARLRGAELLMASCEELVAAQLRLGPAVKVRALVHQLREALT